MGDYKAIIKPIIARSFGYYCAPWPGLLREAPGIIARALGDHCATLPELLRRPPGIIAPPSGNYCATLRGLLRGGAEARPWQTAGGRRHPSVNVLTIARRETGQNTRAICADGHKSPDLRCRPWLEPAGPYRRPAPNRLGTGRHRCAVIAAATLSSAGQPRTRYASSGADNDHRCREQGIRIRLGGRRPSTLNRGFAVRRFWRENRTAPNGRDSVDALGLRKRRTSNIERSTLNAQQTSAGWFDVRSSTLSVGSSSSSRNGGHFSPFPSDLGRLTGPRFIGGERRLHPVVSPFHRALIRGLSRPAARGLCRWALLAGEPDSAERPSRPKVAAGHCLWMHRPIWPTFACAAFPRLPAPGAQASPARGRPGRGRRSNSTAAGSDRHRPPCHRR